MPSQFEGAQLFYFFVAQRFCLSHSPLLLTPTQPSTK